jgi:hypothetical protein
MAPASVAATPSPTNMATLGCGTVRMLLLPKSIPSALKPVATEITSTPAVADVCLIVLYNSSADKC